MSFHAEVILKGGTVVNHDGSGRRDIAISGGKITGIGQFDKQQAGEVIDCAGLHILPGVVDSQVHLREPGAEHKEDLETGGRAAVMGGVTGVFEMPNTSPLTITAEALADKVKRATNRMYCDFAFYIGGTRENAPLLGELERLPGCAGTKVFIPQHVEFWQPELDRMEPKNVRDNLIQPRLLALAQIRTERRLKPVM